MKRKKLGIAIMLIMVFVLSGCGASGKATAEQAKREEEPHPEPDAVVDALEQAGFEVEQEDSFEELGIQAKRITAENGGEYLDICYDISTVEDQDQIVAYYTNTDSYSKFSLVSEKGVVYCYNSDTALQSAGLQ